MYYKSLRSFRTATKAELISILGRVRDALYLEILPPEDIVYGGAAVVYNSDKPWDADTLDEVASAIENFAPKGRDPETT